MTLQPNLGLNETSDSIQVGKIDPVVASYLFNRTAPYSDLSITVCAFLPDPDDKGIILTLQIAASQKNKLACKPVYSSGVFSAPRERL